MTRRDSVREMWAAFLSTRPDSADPAPSYSVWHFGDTKDLADQLVELVVSGRKRATAEALWFHELEKDPVPQVGDYSVVTNWDGRARCVIRTTAAEILPFKEVPQEFAAAEGEGDGSLEYWREVHWNYFGRILGSHGREPRVDMPVVCEHFEVVYEAGSALDISE